LKIFSNVNKK